MARLVPTRALAALLLIGIVAGAYAKEKEPGLPTNVTLLLVEAGRANAAHDIEREREVLEHAESLDGSAEDLADVQRRLAVLDWKYYLRFDEARARLTRATTGAEPAETWLALTRMEQAAGRHEAAAAAAGKALEAAEHEGHRRQARIAVARAAIERAVELRLESEPATGEPLRAIFVDLREMVTADQGHLAPSRLLLRASLLLEEGNAALLAWRSYFHVVPGQPGPNAVARAGRDLSRVLFEWAGAEATAEDRIALIHALGASRMFTEAALVALAPSASGETIREDPRVRELVAYERALHNVRELTDEYYRQTIHGRGSQRKWQNQVRDEWVTVFQVMENGPRGARPSQDRIRAVLDERFGAYITFGTTAGYFDLHMGHRVIDRSKTVEQYGHRADLRFVALDNMVSNGFQSWAWEGGSAHGGWARSTAIYQVRPAYVGASIEIWRAMHEPNEMQEFIDELERESALDAERAEADPYAYLPGLRMRLQYQGVTRLLERLDDQGLEGEELRLAFLSTLDSAVQESSIYAHEGRHAIDKLGASRHNSSGNAEFTAKLSEVAFAPEPRFALGGIISANIGDETPHGQANLRIMKGLVRWMKKHADEIPSLDRERPLLPQLDLLTDEQLREAFRSMDPLA